MGLISPRDFVDVIITRETDEGISTNGEKNMTMQEDNLFDRLNGVPFKSINSKILVQKLLISKILAQKLIISKILAQK